MSMGGEASSHDTALNLGAQMSGVGENPCPCCVLTFKQRVTGFGICFGIGMLLSFLSTINLWTGNYQGFAALYSIGNIMALLSTGFLMGARQLQAPPFFFFFVPARAAHPPHHPIFFAGPITQCKNMFHEKRRIATCVYLVTMIITLSIAFAYEGGGKTVLVLLSVLVQFLALIWYTLSYIPFARDAVLGCLKSCCKMG